MSETARLKDELEKARAELISARRELARRKTEPSATARSQAKRRRQVTCSQGPDPGGFGRIRVDPDSEDRGRPYGAIVRKGRAVSVAWRMEIRSDRSRL